VESSLIASRLVVVGRRTISDQIATGVGHHQFIRCLRAVAADSCVLARSTGHSRTRAEDNNRHCASMGLPRRGVTTTDPGLAAAGTRPTRRSSLVPSSSVGGAAPGIPSAELGRPSGCQQCDHGVSADPSSAADTCPIAAHVMVSVTDRIPRSTSDQRPLLRMPCGQQQDHLSGRLRIAAHRPLPILRAANGRWSSRASVTRWGGCISGEPR